MANEVYDLLGIPSAEAEAVSRVLQPRAEPQRQVYGSATDQAYGDYMDQADQRMGQRDEIAMQADIQRRMALPTVSGARARQVAWDKALQNAVYEKGASSLLSDLQKLDPADPEHMTQQDEIIAKHPIAREALKDPRVSSLVKRQASENAEMSELFDKDNLARQEYADLRTAGKSPAEARQAVRQSSQRRGERLWFATQGGNPDDFDKGLFNGPDGQPDRAKMAYTIAQAKKGSGQNMSTTELKQLDEAASRIAEISDEQKRAAFQAANGREPATEEDWSMAWNLANAALAPERELVASIVQDLEAQGKAVPGRYKRMLEGTTQNVPQRNEAIVPQAAPTSDIPTVQTLDELKALGLPSGARFKTPDGKIRIVK